MSRKKPGSIASEAERLTAELGFVVTPDQIRWWRKKEYDLHDIETLRHELRNQQRVHRKPIVDPDETLAYRIFTEEFLEEVHGTIPLRRFMEYVRDHLDADENCHPGLYAGKTREEIHAIAIRSISASILLLRDVWKIDLEIPGEDELRANLFGKAEN